MAVVDSLFPVAMRLGRPSFVAEHHGFHLLKPPTAYDAESLGFTTLSSDPSDPSQIIPSTQHWQAVKIAKRPGNPYPDRMSVGRALNCDLVLRFPVVSKLHAHFVVSPDGPDGRLHLVDLGSSNGTWRNGVRLEAGVVVPVGPRDLLSFGGVHCEVLDAGGLYALVSGERR